MTNPDPEYDLAKDWRVRGDILHYVVVQALDLSVKLRELSEESLALGQLATGMRRKSLISEEAHYYQMEQEKKALQEKYDVLREFARLVMEHVHLDNHGDIQQTSCPHLACVKLRELLE